MDFCPQLCGQDDPDPVQGACCFFDGACYQVTEDECDNAFGEFHPDTACVDVECAQPPPPVGACCLGDGSCIDVTFEDCEFNAGNWSNDMLCSDVECEQPVPTGACCLGNDECEIVSEADCASLSGDYQGDGTACGECEVIEIGCVNSHGYWKNNPNAWPVNSLTLGDSTYDLEQLVKILKTPVKGNGMVLLSYQLIAARLNQENGAYTPPTVQFTIDAAQALIGDQVIPPWGTGYLHPSVASVLSSVLDEYNNGNADGGPPKCN